MTETPPMRVDARGHRCPVPTLRLRRALDRLRPGNLVLLEADDLLARIDIPHFVTQGGHTLVSAASEGTTLRFLVRKGS